MLWRGKGYPLWYSGLKNSTDCIVDGAAESRTQLIDFYFLDSVSHSVVQLFATPYKKSLVGSSVKFSGRNTGVGYQSPFQGIFPTQASKPDSLHCRWILYHLSPPGKPYIQLHHTACRISSSLTRNRTHRISKSLPLPGKSLGYILILTRFITVVLPLITWLR